MNAVDTNVFVYEFDMRDPEKRSKAVSLLRGLKSASQETVLLWQVATEYLQQLRRWEAANRLSRSELVRKFSALRMSYRLIIPNETVLVRSLDLSSRFSLSHWDGMIVAACLEAGVNKLYTEDMGSPMQFDSLELVNPFA